MKIVENEDRSIVKSIRKELKKNNGYCPCALVQSKDTKCMCKEFREKTTPGYCTCGLYKKIEGDNHD